MDLHNFKQWVGRRECVKRKLCVNFAAADWVCLSLFTRNYRSHMKTKAKISDIWCHLMHKMKLERRFPSFLSRWCTCSGCLDNIWIMKHLIWEAQSSSRWHQPVQTPLYCREHLHMQGVGWGQDQCLGTAWRSRGLCVQGLPQSHSCGTKTPWPRLESLSTSSSRQRKWVRHEILMALEGFLTCSTTLAGIPHPAVPNNALS